ncbi:MAG: hypothetical protein ACI9OJ_001820 [Myxococcota bacterium]|jgi:hypothetical protein
MIPTSRREARIPLALVFVLLAASVMACTSDEDNHAIDYVTQCQEDCQSTCSESSLASCQAGCEATWSYTTVDAFPSCGIEWDRLQTSCGSFLTCTADGALTVDGDETCVAHTDSWKTCTQ